MCCSEEPHLPHLWNFHVVSTKSGLCPPFSPAFSVPKILPSNWPIRFLLTMRTHFHGFQKDYSMAPILVVFFFFLKDLFYIIWKLKDSLGISHFVHLLYKTYKTKTLLLIFHLHLANKITTEIFHIFFSVIWTAKQNHNTVQLVQQGTVSHPSISFQCSHFLWVLLQHHPSESDRCLFF